METLIGYTTTDNIQDSNKITLPVSEFDAILMAIRNSEDGFTYLESPTRTGSFKARLVIFREGTVSSFIWDAENMGFIKNMQPSWWTRIQLKIALRLGI